MPVAKVTSKGQVTIPREVRERLGLRTGDMLEFEEDQRGYRMSKVAVPGRIDRWVGCLRERDKRTVDEIIEDLRGR